MPTGAPQTNLSVGQIYVYDNPLLRRPLMPADVKHMLLGHGGPAVVGNTYIEGTYSEIYPDITQDEAGLRALTLVPALRRMP